MTAGGKTILIVEDDPPSREVVRLAVSAQNHTLLEAATGLEGLQAAREQNPQGVCPGAFSQGEGGASRRRTRSGLAARGAFTALSVRDRRRRRRHRGRHRLRLRHGLLRPLHRLRHALAGSRTRRRHAPPERSAPDSPAGAREPSSP